VRIALEAYTFLVRSGRLLYVSPPLRETTIERIYREVTGRKMPLEIRKVLLPTSARFHYMEIQGRLTMEQLKVLSEELAVLMKLQLMPARGKFSSA
jgi:hypothetical protein